jgi:CheY-like chemotaxis protein
MPQRILIADDNLIFRKALRQLLEGVDHWEVIEAQDGQEAVRLSVESQPDLIVLDLAMPTKDGFTAAREISTLVPATPILMCTMHMSPQLEVEAQKSGIQKVISKSDSSLLLPAIRLLLNPQHAASHDSESESMPLPVVASDSVPAPIEPATPTDPASDAASEVPKNVA